MLLIPDESRLALQTLLLFLNDIAKHCKTNQVNFGSSYLHLELVEPFLNFISHYR